MLCWQWNGTGRGGLLCANNKPSTPRYSPLGKPAHPTDRPTGTIKQLAFCLFLDQPRLPPRPSTSPTFTSFLTQAPIMLTKELLHLPDAPSLLAQRCKLWRELPEHHHLRFTFIARTNSKALRGLARALSESDLQCGNNGAAASRPDTRRVDRLIWGSIPTTQAKARWG